MKRKLIFALIGSTRRLHMKAIGLIIPYLYDEAGRVIEATGLSKNVNTIYTIEYACK